MKKFHIYFGLKDADLLYWKQSIPQSSFSNYVRAVLIAERKRKIAVIPVPARRGFAIGKFESKVYLPDKEYAALLDAFPPYKRNAEIKRILRKHLEVNYNNVSCDAPTESKETAPEENTADDFFQNDVSIATEDDEMSDEYRKMLMKMLLN